MHVRIGSFAKFVNLVVALALTVFFVGAEISVAQQPKASPAMPAAATQSEKTTAADNSATPNAIIVGNGTANTIPVFTAPRQIHNSLITQTGNGINVAGAVNAVAFTGNGSALTNVPAVQLGGLPASAFAQTAISNTFAADQTIDGNLNLTGAINGTLSLQGNLTDANGQQGSNVIGGFLGTAASGGNSIAPGVIGATIAGGGGLYDPSLVPQPTALKGPELNGKVPVRSPFRNALLQAGHHNGAPQAERGEGASANAESPVNLNLGMNQIFLGGDWSTIAGGLDNTTSGYGAVVGGGIYNSAGGTAATVPGGDSNSAGGDYSFAGGCVATTSYQGSFVWAGGVTGLLDCVPTSDTSYGQFVAEASGGVYFYTSQDGASGSGATLAPGSGSWSSLSDRNLKAHFLSIDPRSLLEKLAAMPISTWNYKTQSESIRHLGPTAQDFHEAFGLGEDDKHISTVDAQGVALAGIQALYQAVNELKRDLTEKDREIRDLRARLANLEHAGSTK